jgi:kumamolisin
LRDDGKTLMEKHCRSRSFGRLRVVLVAVGFLVVTLRLDGVLPTPPAVVGGPLALLLASSTDLGPASGDHTQLTVALRNYARPEALMRWANRRGLSVQWRPADNWAIVEGAARDIAGAFAVDVHDYRSRRGQVFYSSAQQPPIPPALSRDVSELGRILGYSPHHLARPVRPPQDVPKLGLTPEALLKAYDATPLAADGMTGTGQTIVFFEFDGYSQADLDSYAAMSRLPQFTPTLIGGQLGDPHGETVMDLEIAHAIAPEARLIVVNALPTVQSDGTYPKIAKLMGETDRQFPGAVWSFSIGWGCDRLVTAADLAPLQSALATVQSHGTTAFDASGDRGGLECKGGEDWSSPPGSSDVGLDAVASLPEMTDVGGTTLSTDTAGTWLAEQAWGDFPLSQGTSGGVSALFSRPPWQKGLSARGDADHRLTPDVAAVADPFTGVKIVYEQQVLVGGGTSQSAPVWAGLTALMNQWLLAHRGHPLGSLNPLLYQVASGAARPAYRDVVLGGNAVDTAAPGFDLVAGLGTPDINNLVHDLLDIQKQSG